MVNVAQSIRLGRTTIPTDRQGRMLISYYGGVQSIPHLSCMDVFSGKAPANSFRDKIVLVGVTAAGTHDFLATPFSPRFSGVEKHAHTVASMIQGRFISRPSWVSFVEFGLGPVDRPSLDSSSSREAACFSLVFCLACLAFLTALMLGGLRQGVWIQIFFRAVLVIFQFLLATARGVPAMEKEAAAEALACPECGPSIEFRFRSAESEVKGAQALHLCIQTLRSGGIVAIKGLGGFHLACDAANGDAVRRLRERKRKSNKPFALMTPDAEAAESFCRVSRDERSLFESAQRPIVLLRKKTLPDGGGSLSRAVAPGNNNIGVMLPYTPLHYLLFYQPLDQDGRDRHSPDYRKDPDRGAGGRAHYRWA